MSLKYSPIRPIASDGGPRSQAIQAEVNSALWRRPDLVERYRRRELKEVEKAILARCGDALSGCVLELGCGAARVTRHLARAGGDVVGVDISPAMVEFCRGAVPGGRFEVLDIAELASLPTSSFNVVVAFDNVIDVLDPASRRHCLADIGALLAPGGVCALSTHNAGYADRHHGPVRNLFDDLLAPRPRAAASGLRHLRPRVANRRRLRRFHTGGPGYEILTDPGGDFGLLHYYTSRDSQAQQFEDHGFELVECLDLETSPVGPGESASESSELHYLARRR